MQFYDLPSQVQEVVKLCCEQYVRSQNTLIILVVGSYAIRKQKMNSDIDVYIIQESNDRRIRGNTWINGLEVEYFINPISQVHNYLGDESMIRPVTATMINSGIIYYQRKDEFAMQTIDNLLQRCSNIVNTDLSPMTDGEIELSKYNFDDLEKDLMDLHHDKSWFNYQLVINQLISQSIEVICRIERKSMMKFKRIDTQLMELDIVLIEMLSKLMTKPREMTNVHNLIAHMEKLLGGKRKNEWQLESDLTS